MNKRSHSKAYERLKKYRSIKRVRKDGNGDGSDSDESEKSDGSLCSDYRGSSGDRADSDNGLQLVSETEWLQSPCDPFPRDDPPTYPDDESSESSSEEENFSNESDVSSGESSYYSYDSSCESETSDTSDGDDDQPGYGKISKATHAVNPIDDLKENLKTWSIKNCITLKALSQLLVLIAQWISRHCSFISNRFGKFGSVLPRDARTLLGTNRIKVNVRPMMCQGGTYGEFVYFGIGRNLREKVLDDFFPVATISLCFNIDGIPLYRSSSLSFWPILCSIYDETYFYEPFPVAIFSGSGKPGDIDDYLKEFVEELTELVNEGILIKGRHYDVDIKCFICDTPARSFVKCTAGHGGFFCCERCNVKGQTLNRKRVYGSSECPLRDEVSFLEKHQEEHHVGTSPLVRVPGIRPVAMFVLDYMHLFCLGVMKRLLVFYWVAPNKKKSNVSLTPSQALILSKVLDNLRKDIPAEFSRKIRGVGDVTRYKATEYRFFLLYVGPIVLKTVLSKDLYKHFLLLHTAARILICPEVAVKYAKYAKTLCLFFFNLLPRFYGPDSQIMNFHNLIHVADDAIEFGCSLDYISAYPFENALGKMKKSLRSPTRPLAQYCRRQSERVESKPPVPRDPSGIQKKVIAGRIKKVSLLNMVITASRPNNFVLLKNDKILEVTKISEGIDHDKAELLVTGRVWQSRYDMFVYPCKSSNLNQWKIDYPSPEETSWPLKDIKYKLIHFEVEGKGNPKHYVSSILHTLN